MATAAFLSAEYIKENTPIDGNVDEKYLKVAIKEAQEIRIRDYLGTGLYDDLVTNIIAGTVSSDYSTLLKTYIAPCLSYWTMYEAAPFLSFKFTNKNIVKKNSDNSSAADMTEIEKVMKYVENKAQYYAQRLVLFLVQNQTTYTKYNVPGVSIDTIFPNKQAYDSDIFLGRGSPYLLTPKEYYNRTIVDEWPY